MPEQQPVPITIHVKPYVRKYLLAHLAAPTRKLSSATSWRLHELMERGLKGRRLVAVVNDYDPDDDRARTALTLLVQLNGYHQQAELDVYSHNKLVGVLSKGFLEEMYAWVDWYRTRLGMNGRQALHHFRRHYSITDSDHDFYSAERLYQKHCQATGQSRPRGRHKKRRVIRS